MADGNYNAEVTAKAVSTEQPTLTEQPALMVLDPLDKAYPEFEIIDTMGLTFGFDVDGDTDIDVVKFSDAEGKDTYAMIVNEDHALAQLGEFSLPPGTLVGLVVDADSGEYHPPSQFQDLLNSTSPEIFAEEAIKLDPAGLGDQLSYLTEAGILDATDVAAITFTDAYTFGLINQSSAVDELSGPVSDEVSAPSTQLMQTMFYSNMAKNASTKAIVYDFEGMSSGNFASVAYDDMLSIHLLNTEGTPVSDQSVGDDPGIATHEGNNADRGFNTTPGNVVGKYLEVLPLESGDLHGGAIFEFYSNEARMLDTRVEAFGFNLMGVEDSKRDVLLDIFVVDQSKIDANGDAEISVIREFMQGAESSGGVQYISYAMPDGPEFQSKAIVGFAIGSDSGTDDRDIFSVDDLVLAVNGSSGFSGLVDPKILLDGVLPGDNNQSGDNGGQGAMPSEDAPGPFWVDGEDRLILTNIGAESSFQPNLQIVAADLETLELYDREMLQLLRDTKGHIALDFEDTTTAEPASVAISADIIEEMGRSISSGASAALVEASASSAASISLIGSSGDWKKESLFGSDYEQMAKRLDPDNTYTLYVNENDGKEVGILVDTDVPVTLNVKANPALSMEASFFGYFGQFLDRGDEFNVGDASGGVIDASQATDAALIQGDDTANTMYGGQGNDTMFGLGGDDVLSGGAGADYIDGGSGNDTIDGGADLDTSNNQGDFTPPVWETGDRARFQGDQENYTVTANADGTFTVKDNVGDDGTDTLRNVEILEFNDTEVLLAPETGSWSYTEFDERGREKLVSEDFAEGTSFSDTIVGGDGRSFLRGGDGNDVLIGDSMSSNGDFASGQDMIDGGKGNDYIDGGGQGSGSQPWEKENAAEYFDASARKYTWVNDSDNTAGVLRLTASEAKAKAKDLGINVEDKYFDQAAADQAFWLLTDKNGDDGLGTDIVTNVDVLRFGDKEIRLKVFKDAENGFYQGTDYDDKIEIEVSEDSYTWNTFVEAGKGDDTVIGSVISDTVILGAGDDFVDGGSQYESAAKAKEASESTEGNSENVAANEAAYDGSVDGYGDGYGDGSVDNVGDMGSGDMGSGDMGSGDNVGDMGSEGGENFDIDSWSPSSDAEYTGERVIEKASDGSTVEKLGNASVYKEDPTGLNGIAVAIAVEGSTKYIVVWDPMENSYVVSDLSTAITTEMALIIGSGDFDDFDGDMNFDDMGSGSMDHDDGMGHGMSMGGGNTGDIIEYQGEFDRYVVTTVSGDDLEASNLVSAEFLARIEALDSATQAPQYLIEDTKITVVQDTVTGKNSTGTDVLINVEKLRFSDGEFNLAVTSEMWGSPTDEMGWGEVNWRGTLGDDRIVDTTYDDDRGYITSDRMDGDAGNDLMISGAGGDRLIGGIGNDIMDGGANAALTDQNRWNIDETIDIAEYRAEIDRFELEKITFEGKTLSIKDANGNLAYMMTPKTKGDAKIGQIFGVDDQGDVGTSVLYQVEEGDTFIVVSDTLPERYGGVGTDILINMEKAQFGYDWEGNVEFQVKYETHTWGGGEGQVDARGTIFDDVIDLRAGKASDFAGGFGGFDDFNTGADIWDGDAFFDAIDNQFDDAVGGFDLWNWQPNASETPLEADVSTLAAFYAGDTNVVAGPFDIYQIELPVADTFTLVAYSRDEMRVVEEVIARDANGDKITLVKTGQATASDYQVFYPDTAADATMPTSDAGDIYNDSLADSLEWTRVAENQSISWPDGFVEDRQFEVYKNNSTDELVAAEFGYAFEPVTEANGSYVFKPIDMGPGAGDANQGAGDFFEYWQPTAEVKMNSELVSIHEEGADGNSFELGKVYDIYTIPDPFDAGTTYLGAYNTQTFELEFEVQPADESGKYFIKPDNTDPGMANNIGSVDMGSGDNVGDMGSGDQSEYDQGGNSSGSQNARLHNSFVQGGRGNDIILAGQGRDEIEGGIGDDFIDGGSESEFLSKFVGETAEATKVKLEDPETGTPGVYSIYADGLKKWAWDGEQDNPSYFEVALTDGTYGIKLAEDGFDFNAFNNDRFNSYDVAFYNGAQVRYDISEVYLKLDAGRPDLKSDGSYQVLTTDAYATAAVADKIGYKKVVKVDDLLPAVAGGEGTDYLLNIEAIRFHDENMDGEVQLEQDSWYFANEMPVSDWAWSPEPNATSSESITEYTSYWGGSQTKWNDVATWNLYTYNADQGISAVYEENTSEWIVTFVKSDDSGGYKETYDNTDWSFTPANGAVVVDSIDTYATEWGGTNDKWNDNSEWNLYETGASGVYALYETETYGWLQGFVQSDGNGGYKEATQISYEGGTNGTIRDDVIVSPNREQRDQIFGKEGDDLIDAGKAIDRIKGGAGDDVIWGGTNVAAQSHQVSASEASSYIEGDVAYYSSAQDQYTVVRNVYVKAAAVGGDVDRDASGRAKIYGDGAIPAKGVVVDTTSDAMTEANGYHAATIVIDRLTDAAGGEGVDVLIGIEGLAFGATDNFYLQDFSHPGGAHSGGPTLSSLEISAYGQTTYHDYYKPGQGWQWVESGGAVYTGTAYDDTIRFDSLSVFEDSYGDSDLRGSDIDEYVFLGEAGDDIIIGNSSADVKGTAVYKGPANEYTVSYNAASKEATVTHNISAIQGGTGVDTLKNIDKIVFNFNANDYFYSADGPAKGGKIDPNVVNLLATTQTVKNGDVITGLDVFGTQFNDNILADSGSFKGRLTGDDLFFSGGTKTTTPGYDYFDGGAGDDVLVLEGMPTRYDVTYDELTSEFTFVDRLPQNVGGQGTIKIKNIETVDYSGPDGPFILTIDGTGSDMVAKLYRTPDDENGTDTLLTTSSSVDSGGNLLTSDDFNMFAISDTVASIPNADHASTVTWASILGTAVTFDAEIEVTTAAIAGVPVGWTLEGGGGGGNNDAAGTNHDNYGGGAQWYSNDSYPGVMLKIDYNETYDDNGTPNNWADDIWDTTAAFSYEMSGAGRADVLKGSTGNDRFSGAPGDDTFDGRGEASVQNWYERESSGDTVTYGGNFARYTIAETTISYGGSDIVAYTVTDSLDLAYGGDGEDTLINIERIEFADRVYNLKIRDISSDWDNYKTVVGTDGDDLTFIDFTDDKTDDNAATDSYSQTTWQLKGGAGNDVIVGGFEKKFANEWMEGDSAIFGADSKYFDVSIEQVAFTDATIDWDNDGTIDDADTTLKDALKARFDGTEIARIVVEDTRDAAGGGLGTDVLYGIENLQFGASSDGQGYDWNQRFKVEAEINDWDGDGLINDFRGTMFGDVFFDDDAVKANTWIDTGAGDDIIIAGGGGDSINPGAGNDYVNGQSNVSQYSDDEWGSRDEVTFWSTSYGQVELEEVTVLVDNATGMAKSNGDGQWMIYGYAGDAALTSDAVALTAGTAPTTDGFTATKAYLVTDTKSGGIGTNLLVGVEAIGFQDQYVEVQGRSNEWSWTDWMTGETITEKSVEGTLFSEILTGASGTDSLSGKGGDDILRGDAGGDRLRGGTGNDLLDGGADGTSGDAWMDSDTAEYNGIEARYDIYQVKVADTSGVASAGNITVYDTAGLLPAEGLDGYTVLDAVPDGTPVETAYIVSDLLAGSLGGSGNDLLVGIEQVQFKESTIDLGLRIFRNDWNFDSLSTTNYYDWIEVNGTDNADSIEAWGTSNSAYAVSDQDSANEIRAKGGDDIIYGYGGGDRINGGTGNDYIDGGDNGVDPEYGFIMKDEAIYEGSARNYTIETYVVGTDDTALDSLISKNFGTSLDTIKAGWVANEKIVVVTDDLPASMGGTGVDVLRNVEFVGFQDKFVALSVEEFIETDGSGLPIRAFVDGTDSADVIGSATGQYDYSGNDELRGNDGDDTISGGKGGDYIEGGAGDDTIDGGEDGIDRWSGEAMGDTVRFSGSYADYEVLDEDVNGDLVITVTDSNPGGDGTDTIRNVEVLEFSDMRINVGVSSMTMTNWEGQKIGTHYDGSIFGDTIEGGDGSDFLYGGKGADTLSGAAGPDMFEGGLGNDTIRGGENGLDEWGNAGQDIAIYSGSESDYTLTFYTSDGTQSSTFEFDGYITLKDGRTDDTLSEGTDTLYGIEALQFNDNFVTFMANNSFIDLDGDGLADVGDQQGTSSADTLIGGDIDDIINGKSGNDTLIGASGDDFLEGGSGSDYILGGSNSDRGDVASFSGTKASYTIEPASGKYVGYDASNDEYELDSNGVVAIFDDTTVGSTFTAEQLISISITKSGVTETDYLAGIEYLEFSDAFGGFDIEVFKDDYDYDGTADFVFVGGTFLADTLKAGANGLTTSDFATSNFIDGGLGADTIEAGAGDDTIDPGRDALVNKLDGGDGNDTVVLSGNQADWTAITADSGYDKAFQKGTNEGQIVHLNDVEGIQYDDQFVVLQAIDGGDAVAVTTEIDNDGDGKADQFRTKGTGGVDAVTAAVGDKVDILDTGAGNDIISTGNGADVIFGGAGDDFIFGGANLGVDDNGNQDKDRAVFEGNYLTGTDANGEAVAADLTVTKKGIIAQLSCDPGTGEVCLLTLNDAKDGFVELKDSAINASATPTVFADVRDVYVASVASTSIYNADTNPDGSKVNSSVKTDANSDAVNLVSDTVGGSPKTFSSGESTDGFDTGTMTLVKAHEMVFEDTNGTTLLAKDAAGAFVTEGGQVKEFADADAVSTYATDNSLTLTAAKASKLITYQDSIGEELDVYEVKKGTEVDTVAGIEQLEFSDTVIDLKAESIKKVSFDVAEGLTEINKTSGTAFGDQIESTAVDEIFSGGDGADVFEFIAGTGSDRITDFKAGVDKLDVLSGVNGTSIATEAGVLARITDTSEGALLDLGNDGSGNLQSVLLIGVSKEDLTSDDFLISHL